MRLLDAAVDLMGRAGRQAALEICGESMRPSLEPGDQVAVAFGSARPRRGDLLLFRQAGLLVVHRFLGRTRRGGRTVLRTRGDGAPRLDPPLAAEQVLGRVVAVRRGAQWFDLGATRARAYAWALGWHGLLWGLAAGWAERMHPALGVRLRRADRALLGLVHRLFFRPCHPRAAPRPDRAREDGARP